MSWTDVTTYTDNSMSHTLDSVADTLTPYAEYRFRMKAENAYGSSDWSEEVVVALAPLPSAPAAVTKVQSLSTKTSMKVAWTAPADIEPITGYKLYLTDPKEGTTALIYDGSNNPNLLSYVVNGLTTGSTYIFNVVALNFNGESPVSADASFKACTAPSGLEPPDITSTTETTIDFAWSSPADNGGCAISGYVLLMDDGAGGAFTATDTGAIANKPYLRSHQVTLTGADTGKTYRAKLQAVNDIGTAESSLTSVILADAPDQPSAAPS